MVKSSTCNVGDVGAIPAQGAKIPHAAEQLSLCITESPCARQRSPQDAVTIQRGPAKARHSQINK